MDERQWLIFKTVADQRSFSKAARILHLSQPTISLQVRALEDQLGARLFERDTKAVHLAPAGHAIYPYASEILRLHQQARQAAAGASGIVAGQLSIGASLTIGEYILPRAIGLFRQQHPAVEVVAQIANTEQVTHLTLEHSVDLGLTEAPAAHRDLEAQPFLDDEMVLIVPKGHRWAGRPEISLEELRNEPLVLREPGSGTRQVFEEYLRSAGTALTQFRNATELSATEAIKGAVEAGLGVSVLSRWTIYKEMALGTLAALRIRQLPMKRQFSIIVRRGRPPLRPAAEWIKLMLSPELHNLLVPEQD